MLNLSPISAPTCQHCGKQIKPLKFKLRPDVIKDGKKYRVVKTRQLPKPNNSKYAETQTIPVIYITEMK